MCMEMKVSVTVEEVEEKSKARNAGWFRNKCRQPGVTIIGRALHAIATG